MKGKSTLALLMSGLMLVSTSIPAFAEATIKEPMEEVQGGVTVQPLEELQNDYSAELYGTPDIKAPVLNSVSIDKTEVEAGVGGTVTVTLDATDEISGIDHSIVKFTNKVKKRTIEEISSRDINSKNPCEIKLNISEFEASGLFELTEVTVVDKAGNRAYYSATGETPLPNEASFLVKNTDEITDDVITSTTSPSIVEDINNMAEGKTAHIYYGNNDTLKAEVFEAIKGQDKNIVLESDGIQWIFNGKDITNPKDIQLNTKLSHKYENQEITDQIDWEQNAMILHFAENGQLPGKATIKIKADHTFKDVVGKDNLYVYYYDNTNKTMVTIAENLAVSKNDQYLEFTIDHNSDYVITQGPWKKPATRPENAVAEMNGTYYTTLEEAVAAAGNDAVTITLIKDVAAGSGIIVPSGSNITFDFAGHSYTVTDKLAGSTGTKTQCFQLLKDSNIVMKNGTLLANNQQIKMIIQNYSNLTLDNMVLDATQGENRVDYVLSNNNGDTKITNRTQIIAKPDGHAFDVCSFSSYEDVSVTVEDAVITGNIEYTGKNNDKYQSQLHIIGGEFNSDFTVSADADVSKNTITGGVFTNDPSKLLPSKDTTPIAKVENKYAVGQESINDAAQKGSSVEVIKGDVSFSNLPAGTQITNKGNGTVIVDGKTVKKDEVYIVPETHSVTPVIPSGKPVYNDREETVSSVFAPQQKNTYKVLLNGTPLKDSNGKVTPAEFKKLLKKYGKDTVLKFDSVNGKKVEARLFVKAEDAAKLKKSIYTRVEVNPKYKDNKTALRRFEKTFGNKNLKAITLRQKDHFNMDVTLGIKMTQKEIKQYKDGYVYLYSFNVKTNKYKSMGKVPAKLDKDAFLRFTTDCGNTVILSDKPLQKTK